MMIIFCLLLVLWIASVVVWVYYLYKTIKTMNSDGDDYAFRMIAWVVVVSVLNLGMQIVHDSMN